MSPEAKALHRERVSASWKDPEVREGRLKALRERKFSPEARAKISAAKKEYWARVRAAMAAMAASEASTKPARALAEMRDSNQRRKARDKKKAAR
jgi:hypothetical protein